MPSEAIHSKPADGTVPGAAIEPALRSGLLSRLMAARGVWALGDQAVCSAGNFLAGLLMARGLEKDPHGFGVYSLMLSVLLFVNSLHGSIVSYPLTLEGAAAGTARFRRLTRRALQFTFAIGPVLAIVAIVAALRMDRLTLLPWTVLAMVAWQAQETVRRALLAKLRHRDAILGDAIRFLGHALSIYVFYKLGILTPEWGMIGIAVTSTIALCVQLAQVRWSGRSSDPTDAGEGDTDAAAPDPTAIAEARRWWRMGRWMLVTCLVNVGTIYLSPWILEAVQGERSVAELAALTALLNLTNPIVFSLAGLVIAAVANATASAPTPMAGVRAGHRVAIKYTLFGAALVVPYYAVVTLFPEFMLSLFFKATSPYVALAGEVKWMTLTYAALFISTMAVSLLNGLGRARDSFVATLSSSIATVVISIPMIIHYGLHGALVAGWFPMFLQLAVALWLLRRHYQRIDDLSEQAPSGSSFEIVSTVDESSMIMPRQGQSPSRRPGDAEQPVATL